MRTHVPNQSRSNVCHVGPDSKMGGAASLMNKAGTTPASVFLSSEVIEGCRLLSSDELLAKSFVEYVKSGAWLDLIAHCVPEDLSAITDTFSYVDGRMTLEGLGSPSNPSDKSSLGGSSKKSVEPPGSSKSGQVSLPLSLDEAYTGWAETFTTFTTAQLSCLLFAVVFPHYVTSATYHRHVKYGAHAARHAEEESVCSRSVALAPGMVLTPHSSRAQEMLLACAAYFDETPMLELVRKDWVETVSAFISTHTFGISVVDTSKIGFPFVYVNKRFESLFGHKCDDILGKPMQILSGEKTEPSKKTRLLVALKSQVCTKLYITRYTAAGRAVQDALAVQPVGRHAVCVHFGACSSEIDPVKVVDDLVALIACLMRKPMEAPPSPAPAPLYRQSSWFGPLQMSQPSPLLARQTSWFGPRALPALNLNTTLPFLLRAVHSPVARHSPLSATARLAHGGEGGGGGGCVERASSRSNCSAGSRGCGSARSHGSHRSGGSGSGAGSGGGAGAIALAGGPARVRSFHSVVSGGGPEDSVKGAFADACQAPGERESRRRLL